MLLAGDARVVFGASASSALLERDFGEARRMMTSSRIATEDGSVETLLFVHGNPGVMPLDVPELKTGEDKN